MLLVVQTSFETGRRFGGLVPSVHGGNADDKVEAEDSHVHGAADQIAGEHVGAGKDIGHHRYSHGAKQGDLLLGGFRCGIELGRYSRKIVQEQGDEGQRKRDDDGGGDIKHGTLLFGISLDSIF